MIDQTFAQEMLTRFGSPLYLYDLDEVQHRVEILRAILPAESHLYYCFKANPLPALGKWLRLFGCRAEVSSTGELQMALEAGFIPSSNILYSGPGKTEMEIREALASGVLFFSCESWHDLLRLVSVASDMQVKVKVMLRVNPVTAPKAKLAMVGIPSRFGFEEGDLLAQKAILKEIDSLITIVGLHIYHGTQIEGAEALLSTIKNGLDTAERLLAQLDFSCQYLDLGGGFPWPYAVAETGEDLSELGSALSSLWADRQLTATAQLWFESGRYLVAGSGTLLTTVLATKLAKENRRFVIVDAGINHLGGMSGLGRVLRPVISVSPLAMPPETADSGWVDIVGPLCTPLDSLGLNVQTAPVEPGDVLSIPNVGAYGLTASLTNFLSRPAPVEITYRGTQFVEAYQLQSIHKKIV